MTGAYLRVERDGKWENIEVEHLTDEEREEIFTHREPEELVRWLNLVCKELKVIDDTLKEIAEEKVNSMKS